MTVNCNTWKIKDQITQCHLNIIILYSSDGQFNYLNSLNHQITAV